MFVIVAAVAHQKPGPGHPSAAWATLAGSVMIWLGVLPWLALWWWSACGWGACVCRVLRLKDDDDPIVSLCLGGTTLMLLTWVTQWGVGLNRITMASLIIVGIAAWAGLRGPGVWKRIKTDEFALPPLPWTAALLAPPLALLAVAFTLPAGTLWRTEAFGYDVLSYHLNVPRQWFDAGAMTALPHDVYGYLPNLVEATFGMFFALRGTASPDAVYLAQGFHVSWALIAALAVGQIVKRVSGSVAAAWCCAAALLAVPWVLITGSLAYNEMVVLALAAAALRVALDVENFPWWSRGAAVGLLVGAATLAKLTAGFMVAIPLGLMLLLGPLFAGQADTAGDANNLRRSFAAALTAALVGVAVLSPYLIRNAAWTGNPVFPFAASTLGAGHWDGGLVERWNAGHGLAGTEGFEPTALMRQWLFNTGYGAVGGWEKPTEARNIARFGREYGVPLLWLSAITGAVLALAKPASRRIAVVLFLWIGFQLVAWHVVTHLQSRFLVTTLVPGVVLVGVGLSLMFSPDTRNRMILGNVWAVGLVAGLTVLSMLTFWSQTQLGLDEVTGESAPLPPWALADALASDTHPFHPTHHPINQLPPDATVLVVADTSRLFYFQPTLVYASAFDRSPMGDVLDAAREQEISPASVLAERGVTHVWIGWSELRRLHATYGHDERVTEDRLRAVIAGWPVVVDLGGSTLVAVPPANQQN